MPTAQFVSLFELGLLPNAYLSMNMIKQLRLASRSVRDCLNRDFWRSIQVDNQFSIFVDSLSQEPSTTSHTKSLMITETTMPSESMFIKFMDLLPQFVNIERLNILTWEFKFTPQLANMISPRANDNDWKFLYHAWWEGIECLYLESDCFWDVLWERHCDKRRKLSIKTMFPKLQHITVHASENPLEEKQLTRIPDVQSMRIISKHAPFNNIIQILQKSPSTQILSLQFPHPNGIETLTNETAATFKSITELKLCLRNGYDVLNMGCLKMVPNLRILNPSLINRVDALSPGMSSFLQHHCPLLDTFKFDSHCEVLQCARIRGLRHVIVEEEELNIDTDWYIKAFKFMPRGWKRTIETVEFDGMRVISREKCEQFYRHLFSVEQGYTSFNKFTAKYENADAGGAVLKVKDGKIVDFFRFGFVPEEEMEFARNVHGDYPDEYFSENEDDAWASKIGNACE